MQGNLIHYNAETRQGLIRATDQNRYAFRGHDWRRSRPPVLGDELDFETTGTVAHDIYVTKPASQAPIDLGTLRQTVTQSAMQFSEGSIGRRLFADWSFLIALVVLIGCAFAYMSFGKQSASLFGIDGPIGQVVDGLTQLEQLSVMTRSNRSGLAPVDASGLTGAKWSLRFAYLLYTIPLLSAWTIVAYFLGRQTRRLAILHGLASAALPIIVPLTLSMLVYLQMPADMRQFISNSGGKLDFGFFGFGFLGRHAVRHCTIACSVTRDQDATDRSCRQTLMFDKWMVDGPAGADFILRASHCRGLIGRPKYPRMQRAVLIYSFGAAAPD